MRATPYRNKGEEIRLLRPRRSDERQSRLIWFTCAYLHLSREGAHAWEVDLSAIWSGVSTEETEVKSWMERMASAMRGATDSRRILGFDTTSLP